MFFYINNTPIYSYKEYKLLTIIQFCDLLYIIIPRFCYHEQLSIAGNCRMCLIELNNGIKPIIACATNISNNIEIILDSLLVKKARENILEFLLINHPLDCPICDQGGECDLQDQTIMYGSDRGRFKEMKRSVEDKEMGPIIKTIMTRCIHCTRCIRFSEEILGINNLGIIGRGSSSEIKMNNLFFLDSELSGNIIDICPVGALTLKPFAFTGRPWDLKSIETIDILDSLNSNIRVDIKGNRILRILPKINKQINEYWISDYIRFSYESIQSFRVKYPLISYKNNFFFFHTDNVFLRLNWEQCFEFFKVLFNFKTINSFNFYLSNGIGLFNANLFYYFSKFVKNSNFYIESISFNNIDNRSNFYINSFNHFMTSNFFIFYNLNIKNNFSIFYTKLFNFLNNSFYKKYIFYIGKNNDSSGLGIHVGNSFFSFFSLLRGKQLLNAYYFRFITKNLNISLINSDNDLIFFLNSLHIFDKIDINNLLFLSNIPGYFEFGLNSTLSIPSSINSIDNISYFYKTSSVGNTNSFIYQGNYLPIIEESKIDKTYIFLPSTNVFEVEDSYINIFGDLQTSNQVLDFSEKEEIKSDFYIFKNLFFYFFYSSTIKKNISLIYSFDLISSELIHYYFNYFVLTFDYIPYLDNYNKNTFLYKTNSFFYIRNNVNLNMNSSFYVKYSKTLRSFYKLRTNKQSHSFF